MLTHDSGSLHRNLDRLESYVVRGGTVPLSRHPAWPLILRRGLGHRPYVLEAVDQESRCRGWLPLSYVRSVLFGRFLVSLPYLNYGGILADDATVAHQLIDRAVELAGSLDVKYLELRHVRPIEHRELPDSTRGKVHMRLALPSSSDGLWKGLDPKVRNQVRKGQKNELAVSWGGLDQLDAFYDVFSRNMRDLGTPVFSRHLFAAVLEQFPGRSELCIVRIAGRPIAGALLLHGWGVTEVPSASSLREFNATCANVLMYWALLTRAIERGQVTFDFGRSSPDSGPYRFKQQWGARPEPAEWQFHVRRGAPGELRPDNLRYGRMIRIWQQLPVGLTRIIGPPIVRGIP